MAFVKNAHNQLSLDDSLYDLTDREKKFLDQSWAKPFADIIFPAIDEESFSVLYSGKASRPNTAVNVIIGALILKEALDLTDDEVMESLMFDFRFQYALHTTSFKEQPLSDRTLSRFRERCLNYEIETGIDLIKNCITNLSTPIATIMGIDRGLSRMDSLMIASNIKKLSRLELLYTCVANLVKALKKNGDDIPRGMEHYLEDNDYNQVIYHSRSTDTGERIKNILSDAFILLNKCANGYDEIKEYKLLVRVIGEQTKTDENGALILKDKDDKTMDSTMLQNPSDPDATYRKKSGKQHRGYSANIIEDVGEEGSVISDYDYQANIYSDSQFLKDTIDKLDKQDTELTLVADGAYGGADNIKSAKDKNIKLVTTNFQGIKANDIFADFEFNQDGTEILKCAGGQIPLSCKYYSKTDQCRITLDKKKCDSCPFKKLCKPKFHKTKASLILSVKTMSRAKYLRYMKMEEFKALAKIRNGVESLPSVLRRKYHVDTMPVRGKLRTKLFFGFKIASINFKKLMAFQNSRDNCVQNPVMA